MMGENSCVSTSFTEHKRVGVNTGKMVVSKSCSIWVDKTDSMYNTLCLLFAIAMQLCKIKVYNEESISGTENET